MSMCRVFSCVVGKGCLLWPACSFVRTLLAFALLHFVQGQTCLLFWLSLDFLLLHFNVLWWKGHLLLVLILEGLLGRHRTSQLQLLWHQWLGHRLVFLWCWMVYLGKEPRSFCHFWVAPKYYISDSTVDYEGYSTSSKGFLLTIVDLMVIWIKFTHSYPYDHPSSKICVWHVGEKVLL